MNKKLFTPRKIKENLKQVLLWLILGAFAFLQTFPFFLKIVDSFHSVDFIPEFNTLYLWPEMFSAANYGLAVERGDLITGFVNSLIHTVGFTTLSLVFALIVGYVLAKKKFRGKKIITILLLSTMMVPGEINMIPNYLLVQKLGWTDTLLAIILPGIINIFGIFLIRQYMNTIPDSLLESAEMDGANELQKIFKIVLPMSKPIIVTYIILTFTATWNEYLWPLITIKNPAFFTLQLKLYQFYPRFGGAADGFIRSAGMILITIPIVIVYTIFQKHFIENSNIAGIK